MNKMNSQRLVGMCVIAVLVAAVFPMSSDAADKIIVVGSEDIKDTFEGKWLRLIYTEVFRRLGYELQYDGYPTMRASAMSDAGEVDGEIERVFTYSERHPNLIRVDESHFSTTIVAYAVKPGIELTGWDSLKNTDYTVDYRRGVTVVERGLTTVVKPENLSTITTTEQGLKKLIVGRIDLYVDVENLVTDKLRTINPAEFDTSAIYKAGIMEETTLHMFLHKKNAALVPKVADVLKAMKQEGLVDRYKEIALEER